MTRRSLPRCPQPGCRRAIVCLLALLALPRELPSQESPGAATPEAQPAAAGSASEDWTARRLEVEQRRERAEQRRDQFRAQDPAATLPQTLTEEIELLQYLELIYAQRESVAERCRELQKEARDEQQRLDLLRDVGPTETPPYSFVLLSRLRDQRAGEISRKDGFQAEIEGFQQLVATLRNNHAESEAKRRRLQEELHAMPEGAPRIERERQLKVATLYSEVLGAAIDYRRAELENAKLAQANAEQRVTFLEEKIERIEKQVRFTQADLQTVLAELDDEEQEVRGSINRARADLQRVEQQWLAARQAADRQPEDRAADERVQALETKREATQAILTLLTERLADILLCRHVWNRRLELATRSAADEQYREWLEEAVGFQERLKQSVNRNNLHVREAMESLATLEQRLGVAERENPDQAVWIQARIDARQQEVNALGVRLVRIDRVQRLLDQYEDELRAKVRTQEHVWGRRIASGLKTCWNYELTAIDDRPITVKKITTGVLLLLIGYCLSRYFSRLLGRRLLPRIGLDAGVINALQTIAFYALLVIFSLFSLQLISIPLTVFAFLGGAVAIGVGFGSQNILNNFISGLILLAERPIRVGDLVEIDGLYGNIETIGARSTRVRTGANLEIIVPNSKFLENNVTNLTLSDTRIRTSVAVGVAYGSPTRDVDRLLREAVASHPNVHAEPAPIVLFKDFGDNSLAFEIHFWINARTMMQSQRIESEVRHTIDDLFREAEITIAFPQRDVHLDAARPLEVHVRAVGDAVESRFGPPAQRRAA